MTTGERIKARREELGMTQMELAEALGYTSKTTIAKIESGANELKQKMIVKIAKALHTTPLYILGLEDDKGSYYLDEGAASYAEFLHDNPDYRVLFDAARNVRPEDIDMVRKLIDVYGKNDD